MRLCRIQTAPQTFLYLAGGYLVGGGHSHYEAWTLVLLGLLVHAATYGHNVIMDYPYDARDPSKHHHPLGSRIEFGSAVRVISVLLAVVSVWLLVLGVGDWRTLFAAGVFIVSGHMYNDHYSKHSRLAWIPISACWTALAAYGMLLGGRIDWVWGGYVFVSSWWQIDYAGRLKDLETGEPSWIRDLGAHVDTHPAFVVPFFWPRGALAYSAVLQGLQFGLAGALLLRSGESWRIAPAVFFGLLMLVTWAGCSFTQPWSRPAVMRNIGLHEVCAVFLGLYLVLGALEALVLCVLGFTFFVAANRVLWRTGLGPRV